MATYLQFDQQAKNFISVLYRVLIVLYGTFFFYQFRTKEDFGSYVVVTLIYLLFFASIKGLEGIFSIGRLILDYIFIFWTLRNVELNNLFAVALLFLPILNSNNHSSKKSSELLYVIPVVVLIWYRKESWLILVPFLVFLIINTLSSLRFKHIVFNENLNTILDNFFIDEKSFYRPYKVYDKILVEFNKYPRFLGIKQIICFKIQNKNISLVNGSFFIYQFKLDPQFVSKLTHQKIDKGYRFDSYLQLNGVSYPHNYCFNCKLNDVMYCYFVIPGAQNFLLKRKLLWSFHELIAPFFVRVSKIFEAYSIRKNNEIESIVEMESKINYVQNAKTTMHFIRNKLGPINHYLAMVADYESDSEIDKLSLEAIIKDERSKLKASVDSILDRAHLVLNRANNPFLVHELNRHNLRKLYTEIKRVWETFFPVFDPELTWNFDQEDYFMLFNDVGLEFVLVNWLNNMKKYGKRTENLSLIEDENFIIVDFSNSIFDYLGADEVVKTFQSTDRIEIMQKRTFGLIEIIDFLRQMNIQYSARISENNRLHLIIKFTKHRN
ncbi:hypothetical protein KIH23_12165 [Flavobacterium sp. CYK-55]|uniref:hypothetical protein n=1 Tax=Flavobacterium sp. CYK-55 TaxID=2835529 RepID=UPI001BCAA014|nr:hypothetical protein [Flavobacterium sp. CYK-55]MBS7788053.1 hypothetical protein [Flavobacterium sp. CYK-55]